MLENKYKTELCKRIRDLFPGCIILHGDPTEIQGIPDLFVLCDITWFALEGKQTEKSSHRPNQDYYVALCNKKARGAFICKENEAEVLEEMRKYVCCISVLCNLANSSLLTFPNT